MKALAALLLICSFGIAAHAGPRAEYEAAKKHVDSLTDYNNLPLVKILDRLAKLKQIAQTADMYVHRMDQMDSIATYQKYLDQGNVVMVLDFKFEVGESRSQPYGDNGQIETGLDYYVSSKRMKCKFTNWTVSAMDANCIQN